VFYPEIDNIINNLLPPDFTTSIANLP
jgi:hypothetical protein